LPPLGRLFWRYPHTGAPSLLQERSFPYRHKIISSLHKIISNLHKIISSLHKIISSLHKIISNPYKIISVLYKIISNPEMISFTV
jgi:hypothetical protein